MTQSPKIMYIRGYNQENLYQLTPQNWKDRMIISRDKSINSGSKEYFWFQSAECFMEYLESTNQRFFYEIIEPEQKCCLYSDIEWYENCGSFSNPQQVIQEFLDEIQDFSKQLFGKNFIKVKDWHILCSTGMSGKFKKFSYHLIDRSGFYMKNIKICKNFMFSFLVYLKEKNSPLIYLPTKKKDLTQLSCPIDQNVYSKWQNLRTIYSTKMGSDRFLVPVDLDGNDLTLRKKFDKLKHFVTYILPTDNERNTEGLPPINYSTSCTSSKLEKFSREPEDLTDWKIALVSEPKNTYISRLDNDGTIPFLLDCIPNIGCGQDWNVYFVILAAVHRSKQGTKEMFKEWASKSNKYNEADVDLIWTSLTRNFRENGYNEGTLVNMAKQCSPEAFESSLIDFNTKLPIVYFEEKYVKPLPLDKKTVICQSPMGSGKTLAMSEIILKLNPNRVLILSPRVTFTENMIIDMNLRLSENESNITFKSYQGLSTDEILNTNYLVIQMESLHKVGRARFDLLLMDESEACLKQFYASTMLSRQGILWDNLSTLEFIFRNAKKRVILDAFLSNRTMSFIDLMTKNFLEFEQVVFVNKMLPAVRLAEEFKNKNAWMNRMLFEIELGKRIVVIWGSQKEGVKFESYLNENLPNVKTKFYHSGGNDKKMKSDLKAVRESWKEAQVLMYTSSITVGVNFDEKDVFDMAFIYASSYGCSARDIIQASNRVRHLKENKLCYYISGYYNSKIRVDLDQLRYQLALKRETICELDEELCKLIPESSTSVLVHQLNVKWKTEENWMTVLYFQNQLEERESNMNFNKVFKNFLRKCGYEVELAVEFDKNALKEADGIGYDIIPIVDQDQIQDLKNRTDVTIMEKLMIQKYFFKNQLKSDVLFKLEKLWWEIFVKEAEAIANIKIEMTKIPVNIFKKEKKLIQMKNYLTKDGIKLKLLQSLYQILNIKNSLDTNIAVPSQSIDNLLYNQSLLHKLSDAFETNNAEKGKVFSRKQALGLINNVLRKWCGNKLERIKGSRSQVKKDGKKVDSYDYLFLNKFELEMKSRFLTDYRIADIFNWCL